MNCKCVLLVLPVILTGLTHPAGAQNYSTPASRPTAQRHPDCWSCAKQYRAEANNPAKLRELVGTHLMTASQMFISEADADKLSALAISLGAARCACDMLRDGALAMEICEDFLLPNLDCVPAERWKHPNTDTVLETITRIYDLNGETDRQITLYGDWLAAEPDSNRADWMRFSLAAANYRKGDYAASVSALQEIGDSGPLSGASALIPGLQKLIAQETPGTGQEEAGSENN